MSDYSSPNQFGGEPLPVNNLGYATKYRTPQNSIPLNTRRSYLSPPAGAMHMSIATYEFTKFSDHIQHSVLATLPNIEGGFSTDGSIQMKFYRFWFVTRNKTFAPLGDLERYLDGVYKIKKDTPLMNIRDYVMLVISFESDKMATKPSNIIVEGVFESRCGA